MTPVRVSLAVEGLLDEQVLRQLIQQCQVPFAAGVCYGRQGRDHLRTNTPRFNQAARFQPFIVLADLEQDECAPTLVSEWLPSGADPNLVLRVAVRMVESWLMADRNAFARFLGVSHQLVTPHPDQEANAKRAIVTLARRSRVRTIRTDLVPASGSTSLVGKNYVGRLTEFVQHQWNAVRASQSSPSLERAIRALRQFRPIVQT